MRTLDVPLRSILAVGLFIPTGLARGSPDSAAGARLGFSAVPENPECRLGDTVRFVFSLHNAGQRDVLVARPFALNQYVWLEILGPSGKELPWCGKTDGRFESPEEFAVLRPGATIR